MNADQISTFRKNIVAIGRLLWESGLASGLNGNISARVGPDRILLTATKTCLGLLQEKDILLTDLDGNVLEAGAVSTENRLHTEIYKEFPAVDAVIHTHTAFINAYFLVNPVFQPEIIEAKIWFGEVKAVEQNTPSVTNVRTVVAALRDSNIAVLRRHGVVATGKDLFDCFLLIQNLEEAVKVDAIARLYLTRPVPGQAEGGGRQLQPGSAAAADKKYELFSREQIDTIVRLVNADERLRGLGLRTKMTMDLAVELNETGQVYSFKFENGQITDVGKNKDVEFVISASADVWRAVFNRQIDPFVATTQKKMNLRGNFAKISQWYEPCCRIFEIWQKVPVS